MKAFILVLLTSFILVSCNQPIWNLNEIESLNTNQKNLIAQTKAPVMTDSIERKNIIKRAEIFNKSDKISYIYLLSYWRVVSFHVVKGKVSSVSSYLTPQEKIVNRYWDECTSGNQMCFTIQAPDIDWSYWTNGDGIFFFTTEGTYIEWKWEYLVSDQPLNINEKVMISE